APGPDPRERAEAPRPAHRRCGAVRRWRTGRRADRPPAANVSGKKTTPYGSWASPITPDLLLKGTVHMRNQMLRWDGDDLYWSELRPYEAGRIVVCRRDADGKRDPITIASGNDFYSSPKLSPDGKRLAWQTWNHPNMPWDESEIWVGELDRDGNVLSSRKIAGGRNESVLQPEWSPSGEL